MTIQNRITIPDHEVIETLRRSAELLPSPDAPDFADVFERFGDARIVLLGEATHGTHEFYAARAAITRRLIERHGFNIVAVEGDWPDIACIDDYVRHNAPRPRGGEPFVRFPTWMWRNEEVLSIADWMRRHNSGLPDTNRVSMRGLDVYSLGERLYQRRGVAGLNGILHRAENFRLCLRQGTRGHHHHP